MASITVHCPHCETDQVVKRGKTGNGKQRYLCQNPDCACKTCILDPDYKDRLPEVKEKMVDMALNGSGIRDTARALEVSTRTVINELKKSLLSEICGCFR